MTVKQLLRFRLIC
ncbi:hypothetical protein V2J09_011213 [Rumex salicifolius]